MRPRNPTAPDRGPTAHAVRWLVLLMSVVGLLGLIGCGGGAGSPGTPQAPPPPAVTVSFAATSLEVREGDSVEIGVRYQVRSLSSPWQLGISPLPESASVDDFELSMPSIEIPAGQGVSGEAVLELTAASDTVFDEGDETVAIRFVPGGGVDASLGTNLRVSIRDAAVYPCTGVSILATPPGPGGPDDAFVRRTFTVQIDPTSESAAMEFGGPYWDLMADPVDGLPRRNTNFAVNIAAWEVERRRETIQHTVDIELLPGLLEDPDLRLAFRGAGCEAGGVICSLENCELIP